MLKQGKRTHRQGLLVGPLLLSHNGGIGVNGMRGRLERGSGRKAEKEDVKAGGQQQQAAGLYSLKGVRWCQDSLET